MSDDLLADLFDMDDSPVEEKRKDTQRAAFGYPGGKFKSISNLMKHLPYRQTWVDHFGGSGVVTLNRQESPLDVFNDRYSGITAFYRCIQVESKCRQLVARLDSLTPASSREEFYHCRATWCTETDDIERAAKWYYMMRCSVIGKGHVFARATKSKAQIQLPPSLELFWPIHYRFKKVIVENLDFEMCVKDFDRPTCVHYFDPPYLGTDMGVYDQVPTWTRDDLTRLLRCIERAEGFCALSHYDDEQIRACKFWKRIECWDSPLTSEVRAFTEENNKIGQEYARQQDTAKEYLYIKE